MKRLDMVCMLVQNCLCHPTASSSPTYSEHFQPQLTMKISFSRCQQRGDCFDIHFLRTLNNISVNSKSPSENDSALHFLHSVDWLSGRRCIKPATSKQNRALGSQSCMGLTVTFKLINLTLTEPPENESPSTYTTLKAHFQACPKQNLIQES